MWTKASHLLTGLAATWIAAGPTSAQEPMSAIDWLLEGQDGPVIIEPPVSAGVSVPEISVTPLGQTAPRLIGLIPATVSGLPDDLWRKSDAESLSAQLNRLPQALLPALQSLVYTLVLAEAVPPGEDPDRLPFTLARIDRLTGLGALDPALALVEQADPATAAVLMTRWFDIALLTGDEDRVCAAARGGSSLRMDLPLDMQIFCDARRGRIGAAEVSFQTARSLDLLPAARLALLERFLTPEFDDTPYDLPPPDDLTPLEFRLSETIGAPVPTAGLPLMFAAADLRAVAGWKAQIEAAERLGRSGALPGNRLLGIYTERQPAASGGVWDRVAALQRFETALNTGNADAIAKTLPPVWQAMRDMRLEVMFAGLFADRLADIDWPDARSDDLALRLRLLSPDYEAVAQASALAGPDRAVWRAVAQGRAPDAVPEEARMRAVAAAFAPEAAADDTVLVHRRNEELGRAILSAISLTQRGAAGDQASLTRGLASLRALGLEDTARRAALQVMLTRGTS